MLLILIIKRIKEGMLKVREEFIGKVLKRGGITIVLSENSKQSVLKFVESRFGDKFVESVKQNEEVEEAETETKTKDIKIEENDYSVFDEYSLKELRKEYPNIKAVSKKDFIDQIYDNN